MYVIREVLHCKPGKVRQMVEKFKAISYALNEMGHEPMQRLTDVTGEPFWTIVAEANVEKVDDRFPFEQKLCFIGVLFLNSLSSALVGGVGRDAEHIVDHIVSTRLSRREDAVARAIIAGRQYA